MIKQLVNEDTFRDYLIKILGKGEGARDCISICPRVESAEGSLYIHYSNDRGKSLMERLFHESVQGSLSV